MIPTHEQEHAAAVKIPPQDAPHHDEALLDQALHETFPASDPISPAYEARLQAAEERRAADAATGPAAGQDTAQRWSRRLIRAAPTLIAFSAFAVALTAVRSARAGRLYVR
jgi:hypothetical protein